jgi:hypothetical protein
LSGCNKISNPLSNQKTLPGGTKVTGDTRQIQIVNFSFIKGRNMSYTINFYNYVNESGKIYRTPDTENLSLNTPRRVNWDLNISGITSNLSKRKQIYLQYIDSDEKRWNNEYFLGEEPFTLELPGYKNNWTWTKVGSTFRVLQLLKITNVSLDAQPTWHVQGVAKNIGNNLLKYPDVIVNFYNSNGAWLSSVMTSSQEYIPSGHTWNFDISYYGEFRNNVSYISFNVSAL